MAGFMLSLGNCATPNIAAIHSLIKASLARLFSRQAFVLPLVLPEEQSDELQENIEPAHSYEAIASVVVTAMHIHFPFFSTQVSINRQRSTYGWPPLTPLSW
jgi:hypothetical protein